MEFGNDIKTLLLKRLDEAQKAAARNYATSKEHSQQEDWFACKAKAAQIEADALTAALEKLGVSPD